MEFTTRHFVLAIMLLMLSRAPHVSPATPCPACGNTTVPFPLSTTSTCGDPLYKIRCSSGTLIFDTLNNSYPIESIDAKSQRLVIRPAALVQNTCVSTDKVHQGIQLNSTLPFNITSSNTIVYLNCTLTLLQSPLNCSAASACNAYINATASASACQSGLCCTYRTGGSSNSYMIRVRDSGCSAYSSFVNLNTAQHMSRWPEPGLEIQWLSPRETVCGSQEDCDSATSTCGPDASSTSGIKRCFCHDGLVWNPIQGVCAKKITCQNPDGCGDSTNKKVIIAGSVCGAGAAIILAIIAFLFYKRHKRIKEAQARLAKEREGILNASNGGRAAKLFSGKEIKKATNDFSNDRLLGVGGYGEVYKGFLQDGTAVAVKCAKLGNPKGTDQVLNEVRILCQVNHRNLVGLLGCCVELEQPILVYEFIENGTVLDHLQGQIPKGRGSFSWTDRLEIARQTAEGLAYLHFMAVPPIYHRDVKSSNILLDINLNAKVSDFGLSRLAQTDMSHISTCAQGTLGYLDPEYYRNFQLTEKSDVYSFGVVLLELLTAQKAIDFNRAPDDVNLAIYVHRMMEEELLMDVIDPVLKNVANTIELETMKAVAFLALGCLEEKRQNRPSMKEVAEEIEYIISIITSAKVV
ncbi:Wall-associated receptor kinase-like 20 [Vigna angularis]|uniref:Wall-associated receptor kinase-like 20 n=1 Tax=Phaseolus angularis TaxID=3914 RepID=A0A8T0L5U9_PHAAN|nr:wall-associated receptor kinase-like 20 [Vigna angularis]KAG2406308.1 Wall-associated receptor kinase-like 20 [Vigna angularis]